MTHLSKYHVGHIQCHFLYSLSSVLLHVLNIFLLKYGVILCLDIFTLQCFFLWTVLLHVFIPGTMCSYI